MAPSRYYQRAKNGIHALQALLILILATLTIAVFTQESQGDGRIRYAFVLVSILHFTIQLFTPILTIQIPSASSLFHC